MSLGMRSDRRRSAVFDGLPRSVFRALAIEQTVAPISMEALAPCADGRASRLTAMARPPPVFPLDTLHVAGDRDTWPCPRERRRPRTRRSAVIGEDNGVDLWIERHPAPAIASLVIGGEVRGVLIQMRYVFKSGAVFRPTTDDPGH